MTNVISALTARTQLGQVLQRTAQKNERFVVQRRGLCLQKLLPYGVHRNPRGLAIDGR